MQTWTAEKIHDLLSGNRNMVEKSLRLVAERFTIQKTDSILEIYFSEELERNRNLSKRQLEVTSSILRRDPYLTFLVDEANAREREQAFGKKPAPVQPAPAESEEEKEIREFIRRNRLQDMPFEVAAEMYWDAVFQKQEITQDQAAEEAKMAWETSVHRAYDRRFPRRRRRAF